MKKINLQVKVTYTVNFDTEVSDEVYNALECMQDWFPLGMDDNDNNFSGNRKASEAFKPPCKFKDGDILSNGICVCIYNGNENDEHYGCYVGVGHIEIPDYFINRSQSSYFTKENSRLATEEEKEKLFDAIKANGYEWNPETKTLKELIKPRFKVGDKIKHKSEDAIGRIEKIVDNVYYVDFSFDDGVVYVGLKSQDDYELFPNKFDITTLKTFDKVLVRLTNNCVWKPKFFSHYDADLKIGCYPFITTDDIGYPQCIPHKGNEHLCRTTNDCDEFYKTWR